MPGLRPGTRHHFGDQPSGLTSGDLLTARPRAARPGSTGQGRYAASGKPLTGTTRPGRDEPAPRGDHLSPNNGGDAPQARATYGQLAAASGGQQRSIPAQPVIDSGHEKTALTWVGAVLRKVARAGVEPATFRFSGGRSYQLSYLAGNAGQQPNVTRP
jgi:hypothetical protein